MNTGTTEGATAPAKQPRKRTATTRQSGTTVPQPKESRAEEVLHEIFRSQGMDLRESARTRGLVSDLFSALKGGGK